MFRNAGRTACCDHFRHVDILPRTAGNAGPALYQLSHRRRIRREGRRRGAGRRVERNHRRCVALSPHPVLREDLLVLRLQHRRRQPARAAGELSRFAAQRIVLAGKQLRRRLPGAPGGVRRRQPQCDHADRLRRAGHHPDPAPAAGRSGLVDRARPARADTGLGAGDRLDRHHPCQPGGADLRRPPAAGDRPGAARRGHRAGYGIAAQGGRHLAQFRPDVWPAGPDARRSRMQPRADGRTWRGPDRAVRLCPCAASHPPAEADRRLGPACRRPSASPWPNWAMPC